MMMFDTNISGEFFSVRTIINSTLQILLSFSHNCKWGGTSTANWVKLHHLHPCL